MNVIIKLSILSCALFMACNTQRHNITGEISGLGSDTLFIESIEISKISEEDILIDTIISSENNFIYDLRTEGATLVMINPHKGQYNRLDGTLYWPESNKITLILTPQQKVTLKGELNDNYLNYQVNGSKLNKDLASLREEYLEALSKFTIIEMKLDSTIYKDGFSEITRELFKERNKFREIQRSRELDFILTNKDYDLSGFLLFFQSLDTIGKYYYQLAENVTRGLFQPMLDFKYQLYKKYIIVKSAQENIQPGKKAPIFTLRSNSGKNVTLNDIISEYIILDFWGSWCMPCINGLPQMKEYYKKYNDRIEIVGIACNDKEDNWVNAIDKYKLDWIHLFNEADIEKDISLKYGIEAYPTKIILNKHYEIIGIYQGEGEDFYEKLDELLL